MQLLHLRHVHNLVHLISHPGSPGVGEPPHRWHECSEEDLILIWLGAGRQGQPAAPLPPASPAQNTSFVSQSCHVGPTSFIVIGIYRPPSAGKDSVETLGNLIAQYTKDELIVTGDFNLLANWLNSNSDHLKEVSGNLNLTQLLVDPTRPDLKDSSKSSWIDLFFTNRADKIVSSGVFELGFSDHCPTACIRSTRLDK